MHGIRLDELYECPHDSVTSDLACGQWRLAARVDVPISDGYSQYPVICVPVISSHLRTTLIGRIRWRNRHRIF